MYPKMHSIAHSILALLVLRTQQLQKRSLQNSAPNNILEVFGAFSRKVYIHRINW
jgi:hypothetical protein